MHSTRSVPPRPMKLYHISSRGGIMLPGTAHCQMSEALGAIRTARGGLAFGFLWIHLASSGFWLPPA